MQIDKMVKARLDSLMSKVTKAPAREIQFKAGASVLVISPHYDDDVISCFGAIRKHYMSDCKIDILYIADGVESLDSGISRQELCEVRKKEASAAVHSFFPNVSLFHMMQQDGKVTATDESVDFLANMITGEKYDYIYCTGGTDSHKDHRATYAILKKALDKTGHECTIRYFEFWKPLDNANVYVDISDCLEAKKESISYHESQLKFIDYVEFAEYVNLWRGQQVGCTACEAYEEVMITSLKEA
ncbi:MAG: PIG-L family deacetylase [Lachnospiraceae bacterium]|nr:PIG-L family deacetylase [Lachnospiraceae bacterium]